jgi:glutaredoxin
MSAPILYVKRGCPYCAAAMDYLDQHQIAYEQIDVRGDEEKMQELKKISGQTKTPTLVWDGEVLADFGVNELEKFLAKHPGEAGRAGG